MDGHDTGRTGPITNAHLLEATRSVERQFDIYRTQNDHRVGVMEADVRATREGESRLRAYIDEKMDALFDHLKPTVEYVATLKERDERVALAEAKRAANYAEWRKSVTGWMWTGGIFTILTFLLLVAQFLRTVW